MDITLYTDPSGPITLRDTTGHTMLYAPGAWRHGEWHATNLTTLPTAVRDVADELWTPALVAAYRAASEPPVPTTEDLVEAFRAAIQSHVDTVATSRRYDSAVSLASYVASNNPAWAAEAQAFVAWRDAVWVYAYAEIDKVLNGQRDQPGIAEFIGELPAMVWPGEGA